MNEPIIRNTPFATRQVVWSPRDCHRARGMPIGDLMAGKNTTKSMALYCDLENVARGVRESKYADFDIGKVLERLLLKGDIVVKKAYCDWDRFKEFKAPLHEAAFELIEIPHVRMSGKNSADIRMVVDALDLCYTKSHVDMFVIISGDSDFSALVSKLRENNKVVIGVGVKNSTSKLLVSNCDEFIYYDDLILQSEKNGGIKRKRSTNRARRTAVDDEDEKRRKAGLDLALQTVEDLLKERGAEEKVWASMVKQTLKRRKPEFNEAYYGFRTFGELLEEAQTRELLELEHDKKSGSYIIERVLHNE